MSLNDLRSSAIALDAVTHFLRFGPDRIDVIGGFVGMFIAHLVLDGHGR
jgi:hypothetical protein